MNVNFDMESMILFLSRGEPWLNIEKLIVSHLEGSKILTEIWYLKG